MIVKEIFVKLGIKTDEESLRKAQRSVDNLQGSAKKLKASFASGVKQTAQAVAGLGAIGAGAIVAGKQIAELAGDVEETNNLIDTAFGKSADSFRDFADTLSANTGKSKFELRELGASLQATVGGLTQDTELAAKLTQSLTERGVDLASVFNLDVTTALNKLRSGITGEAEPLKSLGIVMNATTLKSFALAQGIQKTTKEMTQAELATLRTNFILAQTSKFHGDATKTSGSLTNQMRALESGIKDTATQLAVSFGPELAKVVGEINKMVTQIRTATSNIEKFKMENSDTIVILQTMGATIVDVFNGAGQAIAAFASFVVNLFSSGGDLKGSMFNLWLDFADIVDDIFGTSLRDSIEGFTLWFRQKIDEIAIFLRTAIPDAAKAAVSALPGVGLALRGFDAARSALSSSTAAPSNSVANSVNNNQSQTNNITINAAAGQSEQAIGASVARQVDRGFQSTLNQSGRAFAFGG